MTPYELMELAIGVGNRIDVQLGIFITVHLAIFGGIIYVDRPLRRMEKGASIFIYTLFAVFNYRIMQNQLDLSLYIDTEIAKFASDPCCTDNALIGYVSAEMESGVHRLRRVMLNAGHIVFYAMVLLSIFFDQALSKMTRPGTSAK